jgi:hypothetical protein
VLTAKQKRSTGVFRRLLAGCFIHPSTAMVRRTLFDRLGPFETRLASQGDYLFWMRAAKARPTACLPETLVTVRRSAGSMSQHHEITMMKGAIGALEMVTAVEPLTLAQRLVARRTLARWYLHLARLERDSSRVRADIRRSLRLNPLQRQAWIALTAVSAGRQL